jgi:hypothetical protein
MRAQFVAAVAILLFTGCATTGHYQTKVQSWEDHDAQALVNAWGKPDSIEKLSSGNQMYVYSRLKHAPVAYGTQRMIASSPRSVAQPAGDVYIRCATYFEVSPQNKIVSTLFRGDECKSRD